MLVARTAGPLENAAPVDGVGAGHRVVVEHAAISGVGALLGGICLDGPPHVGEPDADDAAQLSRDMRRHVASWRSRSRPAPRSACARSGRVRPMSATASAFSALSNVWNRATSSLPSASSSKAAIARMASMRSGGLVEEPLAARGRARACAAPRASAGLRAGGRRSQPWRPHGDGKVAPRGLGVAELLRHFVGKTRDSGSGDRFSLARVDDHAGGASDRRVLRARPACPRAGSSCSFGGLPIAATSGSSASASTARRAANCATSGMLPCAGTLERERRILGDERLDAEPQQSAGSDRRRLRRAPAGPAIGQRAA